jgi:feruloyl-CoA synthase
MTEPRAVRLGPVEASFVMRADGALIVECPHELPAYAMPLTARLVHWAEVAPERVFLARRGADRAWVRLSYAEALRRVRGIAGALLTRGVSAERPVAILSGNSLAHALLGLACLHAGIPYVPVSVAYSLISTDHAKLRHIIGQTTPGLVFAEDAGLFGKAIAAAVPEGVEVLDAAGLEALAAHSDEGVDAAFAAVTPETVAKILYTSGSTGLPKGVINTQRMLCANQAQLLFALPFMADEPPVLVDWLPWNHTFGGNHNVGLVLYNGGTLYIDDGKPLPGRPMEETIANLREVSPTIYFNVPKGYEELIRYLAAEPVLRESFFRNLRLTFYSAAGLAQHIWDELARLAIETVGAPITMLTGLGATETAPFAVVTRADCAGSGVVGLPTAGVSLKLVPNGEKLEARIKGPNVTPGYWRDAAKTAEAFDEEGWYKFGDALRFVDPERRELGFAFDGRVSEDFKLATGTWVSVGPLRARIIAAGSPWVRDAIIAGIDKDYIAVLIVPQDTPPEGGLQALLASLAASATGSSTLVRRAALIDTPLSIDAGEVTDKGSLNQRAALRHRADRVAHLFADPPPSYVVVL